MEAISQITILEQDEKIRSVYETEKTRLLNFIRSRIQNPTEAEDLLQDVFIELTEAYRMMDPIERVSSWMFTVARNKITDLFRKKRAIPFSYLKTKATDEDSEEPMLLPLLLEDAEFQTDQTMQNLILEEIHNALQDLPEKQRWVFEQHEIEGLSFNEISEITGEQVNTLISRKRYAVVELRIRLRELYDEIIND